MVKLIPRADYKRMPWKNGLGETFEIDREPQGENYLWRLSQATIKTDSPFSSFPGYDRWLCVWKGDGIFLNDKLLAPLSPLQFAGDQTINCRLKKSAVLDIGLIYDRAHIQASMKVITPGPLNFETQMVRYLFDLESGDTLKFETAQKLNARASLLIEIAKI